LILLSLGKDLFLDPKHGGLKTFLTLERFLERLGNPGGDLLLLIPIGLFKSLEIPIFKKSKQLKLATGILF
jgi:hypothetical protein